MVGVAFVAGTLIVALVAYNRVTEQHRDLGVLKALGATPAPAAPDRRGRDAALTGAGALAAVVLLLAARGQLLAVVAPRVPASCSPAATTRRPPRPPPPWRSSPRGCRPAGWPGSTRPRVPEPTMTTTCRAQARPGGPEGVPVGRRSCSPTAAALR